MKYLFVLLLLPMFSTAQLKHSDSVKLNRVAVYLKGYPAFEKGRHGDTSLRRRTIESIKQLNTLMQGNIKDAIIAQQAHNKDVATDALLSAIHNHQAIRRLQDQLKTLN